MSSSTFERITGRAGQHKRCVNCYRLVRGKVNKITIHARTVIFENGTKNEQNKLHCSWTSFVFIQRIENQLNQNSVLQL